MRFELPSDQAPRAKPPGTSLRRLKRRTVIALASTTVPLGFDAAFLHSTFRVRPGSETLFINAPGLMIGISWGLLAVLICMALGVLIGLPVAIAEAVRYRRRRRPLPPALETLVAVVPWSTAFLVAFAIGSNYVFPPVGGPLILINTLLARLAPATLDAVVKLWEPLVARETRTAPDALAPPT